ncbi:MAG: ABC transporter ATP-binding protein [Bacilli bacterium]|nr:ABC transporter ATP-binding protein [Bacilli bacterium]
MENINFIFKSLNKKKLAICLILEAFLDIIYYIVPFSFTLFLTLPFTPQKAFIVIGIFLLSKILRVGGNYLLRKYSDNYLYEYSKVQYEEYYKKLSEIPTETISKYQTGYFEDIISKITDLVQRILSAEYISILITFLFLFYTLYNQSFFLFIISFISSILCVLISIKILRKANNQVELLYDEEYKYSSIYTDFISNIRTVKLLNSNKYFVDKIAKEGKHCYKENEKYVKYYSTEEMIRNILIVVPFFLGLLKAVIDLSNGIDTIGIITFYISLQVEMGFVFEELTTNIINWYELKAIKNKLKVIFKKLDKRKKISNFKEVKLSDVIIHYPKTNLDIKVDNLIINNKDKISITGKSGQGKTSVINLLLGNISTFKGNINIDDNDFNLVKLDIGVVSQEIELFNMSIKDNLCLNKKISDEELMNYLKELELDEILLFEEGIDTIVGEKGLKLSTGQKRRINLLRSYLMNKEIYVLDEPTSNLDKHTEDIVVNFILKYFSAKTLIIATHNEKINKICNKFYYFEDHNLKEKKI